MKITVGIGLVGGVVTLGLFASVLAQEWADGTGLSLFWVGAGKVAAVAVLTVALEAYLILGGPRTPD